MRQARIALTVLLLLLQATTVVVEDSWTGPGGVWRIVLVAAP